MAGPSDLAPLLKHSPAQLGLRQGELVSFNPDTGENSVRVGGAILTNLRMFNTGDSVNLAAGDSVVVVRYLTGYFILGRIVFPGSAGFAAAVVEFGVANGSGTGFALSTAPETKATAQLAVPSWANQALISATMTASVTNGSAGPDFLNGAADIGDTGGGGVMFVSAAPGQTVNLTAQVSRVLTDPPPTVDLLARLWATDHAWPADAAALAVVQVAASFRRVR